MYDIPLRSVNFLSFLVLVVNSFAPWLRLKLLVTKEINSTTVVMGPPAALGGGTGWVIHISLHEEMLRIL